VIAKARDREPGTAEGTVAEIMWATLLEDPVAGPRFGIGKKDTDR
jgi:hypothetical protein